MTKNAFENLFEEYQNRFDKIGNSYDFFYSHLVNQKEHFISYEGSQKRISKDYIHYEHFLRVTLLQRLLSFLESFMIATCKLAFDNEDYDNHIKKENGNWLKKHIDFINQKTASVERFYPDSEFIEQIIILRNCFIHSDGNIARTRNPDKTKNTIEKINKLIDPTGNSLAIWKDNNVTIYDHVFIAKCFDTIENLFADIKRIFNCHR